MTKEEIIENISVKCGYSKKDSTVLVEQVLEILKATLSAKESVKITGFGNFVVKEKKPRRGRNPQTGEEMVIDGRYVLTFKPSAILKTGMNK